MQFIPHGPEVPGHCTGEKLTPVVVGVVLRGREGGLTNAGEGDSQGESGFVSVRVDRA